MTDTTNQNAKAQRRALINITVPAWDMRGVLATLSTILFGATLLAPLFGKAITVDSDLKGAIILQWGLVMGYYFGTSKTSVAKDATIATQATAMAAAAPDAPK